MAARLARSLLTTRSSTFPKALASLALYARRRSRGDRHHHVAAGELPRRLAVAGAIHQRPRRARPAEELQRLWPLRRDDHDAARNRRRGEHGWRPLAALQFSLEARRPAQPPWVGRPTPATARLADVG